MSAFKGPWTVGRIVGSVVAFSIGTVGAGYMIRYEWKRAHMNKLKKEYAAEQSAKFIHEKQEELSKPIQAITPFEAMRNQAKKRANSSLNEQKANVNEELLEKSKDLEWVCIIIYLFCLIFIYDVLELKNKFKYAKSWYLLSKRRKYYCQTIKLDKKFKIHFI